MIQFTKLILVDVTEINVQTTQTLVNELVKMYPVFTQFQIYT